jgi:hypothetical protein
MAAAARPTRRDAQMLGRSTPHHISHPTMKPAGSAAIALQGP